MPVILSIDTSCDETSVAVTQGLVVISNVIASQVELHKKFGGVFPTVAKQAHIENIDACILLALKKAQIDFANLDAIAVTQGPGLAPALEVGINKAKQLAEKYQKPLIAVNHIEGHLLSPLAQRNGKIKKQQLTTQFPVLSIIVSGGHTQFVLVTDIGQYQILGLTIDDAAGEALDKVGRMLDLGYPAGSVIEEFAKKGDPNKIKFALPMTTTKDFNLSFSGLKTQARNLIEKKQLNKQEIFDFAASFQYAVFRHICYKLNKVLQTEKINEIWLGGGVAANITLRRMIRETIGNHKNLLTRNLKTQTKVKLYTPFEKKLCGDNAAMIGVVAYFKFINKNTIHNLNQLDRIPRLNLT